MSGRRTAMTPIRVKRDHDNELGAISRDRVSRLRDSQAETLRVILSGRITKL